TQKGIELLYNDKGFFMMVEAGKIDWACHANDAAAAIKDTLAFDRAVEKAYAFYKNHPDDTLIVVTGDHECGGMSIGFAGTKYETYFHLLKHQKVSFTKFDQTVVKALKESGNNPSFEDIKADITENFGLVFSGETGNALALTAREIKQLETAFQKTLATEKDKDDEKDYLLYGGYEPLTITITNILNQKAGISWTSYQHTGVPVGTSAIGVGAENYQGAYENSDLALKMMDIMGMKPVPVYALH
ncbi:MAG: alkaline phosphatase, partial [Desulfamplus sp.]|nr:alkaline phosphatase [Desulfamplus sp.]